MTSQHTQPTSQGRRYDNMSVPNSVANLLSNHEKKYVTKFFNLTLLSIRYMHTIILALSII